MKKIILLSLCLGGAPLFAGPRNEKSSEIPESKPLSRRGWEQLKIPNDQTLHRILESIYFIDLATLKDPYFDYSELTDYQKFKHSRDGDPVKHKNTPRKKIGYFADQDSFATIEYDAEGNLTLAPISIVWQTE